MVRHGRVTCVFVVITSICVLWYISHTSLPLKRGINFTKIHQDHFDNQARDATDNLLFIKPKNSLLKIYIYDLPASFNTDIEQYFAKKRCYDASEFGNGQPLPELSRTDGMMFRDTWHGTLEPSIHHRLLHGPHRTLNPEKAHLFYIPYYAKLLLTCSRKRPLDGALMQQLFSNLTDLPFLKQGRPHFMTVNMPEAFAHPPEQAAWLRSVVLIVVEAHDAWRDERHLTGIRSPLIVSPYAAAGHFTRTRAGQYALELFTEQRRIFVFLAAVNRPGKKLLAGSFRHDIVAQLNTRTVASYEQFIKGHSGSSVIDELHFIPVPKLNCDPTLTTQVVGWMRHSVFCLQPPGDTNSRKSFYDAIVTGCIPVTFELPYVKHVTYPFERMLNYSQFTVRVPLNTTFRQVLSEYRDNNEAIQRLQTNLATVMQYLQYNDMTAPDVGPDALDLILNEVTDYFDINVL